MSPIGCMALTLCRTLRLSVTSMLGGVSGGRRTRWHLMQPDDHAPSCTPFRLGLGLGLGLGVGVMAPSANSDCNVTTTLLLARAMTPLLHLQCRCLSLLGCSINLLSGVRLALRLIMTTSLPRAKVSTDSSPADSLATCRQELGIRHPWGAFEIY